MRPYVGMTRMCYLPFFLNKYTPEPKKYKPSGKNITMPHGASARREHYSRATSGHCIIVNINMGEVDAGDTSATFITRLQRCSNRLIVPGALLRLVYFAFQGLIKRKTYLKEIVAFKALH